MRILTATVLAALLAPAPSAFAQAQAATPGRSFYRVEFKITDSGGESAKQADRRYAILTDTEGHGVLRIGNKIPIAVGNGFQYQDVGVNIDCRLRELNEKVALTADLDVSTVVQHDPPAAAGASPPSPTLASVRVGVNAMLRPGVPTMVASIDDPVTSRKFAVEATVTKLD